MDEPRTNGRDYPNFKLDHYSIKVITAKKKFSQRHNVVFYRDACAEDSLIAVSLSIPAAWAGGIRYFYQVKQGKIFLIG